MIRKLKNFICKLLGIKQCACPEDMQVEVSNKNKDGKISGEDFAMMAKGGKVKKGYHKTKDGRTVKKGLYYYMNRAKKRGTSKPGKGTVSDKALKRSAKTAKKK